MALLLGAPACGSLQEGAGSGESPTDTVAPEPRPDDHYTSSAWSWFMLRDNEPPDDAPSPVKQLAVFRAPIQQDDALPASPIDDSSAYEDLPEKSRPGREIPSESRRLIGGVGPGRRSLFAVPTEKGWVCVHLVNPKDAFAGASGACAEGLLSEGVYFWMSGTQSRYEIYGLIANDVRRILVAANGESHAAALGRNGFFFDGDPLEVCPTDIDYLVVEGKQKTRRIALNEPAIGSNELHPDGEGDFGCR